MVLWHLQLSVLRVSNWIAEEQVDRNLQALKTKPTTKYINSFIHTLITEFYGKLKNTIGSHEQVMKSITKKVVGVDQIHFHCTVECPLRYRAKIIK